MVDDGNWPTSVRNDLMSCLGAALAALDEIARAETAAWVEAAADLTNGRRLTEDVGVGWISAEDVDLHWDRRLTELMAAGVHRDVARSNLLRASSLFSPNSP